ncbi:MAG: YbhB/YbcL family Raf kinase inhibitor-like protein [Candidatus Babeliales bacterium]
MNASSAQANLTLTSQSFKANSPIPSKYGYVPNENISPQLSWTAGPKGTKSYAIICRDPDAPTKEWVHLVAFNIPVTMQGLPEGALSKASSGISLGTNDYGKTGYGGPKPPSGTHRYYFDVYALGVELSQLTEKTTKANLLQAMQGHILAKGSLMGTYKAT